MKIKQVQYEKLFGFFDYSIDFHETVTIIHGPNGCGKTTMLKIIDAVFNKKLDVLKTTDFKSVQFLFTDSSILKIERKRAYLDAYHEGTTGIIYLAYTITKNGQNQVFDTFENSDDYLATIKKFLKGYRPFPWLERISDDMWLDKRMEKSEARQNFCEKPTPKLRKTPLHLNGVGAFFSVWCLDDVFLVPGTHQFERCES